MQSREAIVLAGGFGTRLKDVLPDIPKCMAPVQGKPFLCYVLDYLESQKVNKVILSVGYLNDQIINYFGSEYNKLKIDYAIENEPLGTGGAVKLALKKCVGETVFVVNGDTYFLPDLQELEQTHTQTSADITIAVKMMPDASRYGLVIADSDGRITAFEEKHPGSRSGWINGGIYLLGRNTIDNYAADKFSLEREVFNANVASMHLQAYKTDAFFLDMGIPEDYARAQDFLPIPGKV